jgi:hypothetical protein
MKSNLFILFVILFSNNSYSIPIISNVNNSSNIVGLYKQFEITFNLNSYSNPYNPDEINSYCEFWSPSGKYFKVYAFYFKDFTKSNTLCDQYDCELLTANGVVNWKIRFTPNEVGNWKYKLIANDNSGQSNYPSLKTLTFKCENSLDKGFIHKANNKFLKRTNGDFFFPVGLNVAWYNSPIYWGNSTYGTNEYKFYIDEISNNKANFIRIFLDVYESIAIIGYDFTTQQNYFDLYNQKDSKQLDIIINYAKEKNVNIMLCLFSHASWGNSSYCFNAWNDRNPFNINKGGPLSNPFQFFSNQNAISKTKNLIKYIVSRWGYATNLLAWELWNEVNQIQGFNLNITPPITYQNDIKNWHLEMYNYIKSIDPFKHLITTSYAGGLSNVNQSVFSDMDFIQTHHYKNPVANTSDNFQDFFFEDTKNTITNSGKPYLNGEWGFSTPETWSIYDPKGIELHNTLWSSSFSTSFGSVSNWWWDNYIKPKNLFSIYKPVAEFTKSLDLPSGNFNPYKKINNGLRTFYMTNNNIDTIYGWSQDINFQYQSLRSNVNGLNYIQTLNNNYKPNSNTQNNEIIIPVNRNNLFYKINWYNAETGLFFQSTTALSSDNSIKIYIPSELRTSKFGDAAFKIFLDCEKFIWEERILNDNSYDNVSDNLVCNKNTGQVFYKTFDNKINSIWWDNISNTWQWSGLNNSANNVSGDLAINNSGNKIFYKTTDNKINLIWWDSNNQNWQWSNLNQASTNNVKGPIIVNVNDQVFYRTYDNKLNNLYWNFSNNSWNWSNLNNSANNVGDEIASSINGQIFYKTLNNKINSIYWNSSNWLWSNLNNSANGNVCGNLTISNNNQVFYKTCDNKINNIWWDSNNQNWQWSDLNNSALNVSGELSCDNLGKIYYKNLNLKLNCIYWENSSWHWSGMDNAINSDVKNGNILSSNISNGYISNDNLGNVFFIGYDNKIHRAYYKSQCFYENSMSFHKNLELNNNENDSLVNKKIDDNINELFLAKNINIFPNPVKNSLNINSNINIINIKLYNIEGKLVISKNYHEMNSVDLNLIENENGLYFIKLLLENNSEYYEKIIINKE